MGTFNICYVPECPCKTSIEVTVYQMLVPEFESFLLLISSKQQEHEAKVHMNLRINYFGDTVFLALAKFPSLLSAVSVLHLRMNYVTDVGIAHFFSNFMPVKGYKLRNIDGTYKKTIKCYQVFTQVFESYQKSD
jgi:hypothetical protein